MTRVRKFRVGLGVLFCLPALPAYGQGEGTPLARLKALKAERLSAVPQAALTTPLKTVYVYCGKGDTISAALAKNTGPLVIEVRGICSENVLIERSDLTLRGLDPASDGIRGVTTDPLPLAAIEIKHASRIRLENISVTDSPMHGLVAHWSELVMQNCRVARSARGGIAIGRSSYFTGTEVVASENGVAPPFQGGIGSGAGSWVSCLGCRLVNNGVAARSSFGGVMTLWDSVIEGNNGIGASWGGSYVDLDCQPETSYPCSLTVTGTAVNAREGGEAALLGVGPFTGRLFAARGHVSLSSAEQVSTDDAARRNTINDSSTLRTDGVTKLQATYVGAFSHATLWDSTELQGILTCDAGGDAWSAVPYPPGTVSGCEHILTTP